MKHPLNEIKRLQQLAGLNEWKIQPPSLYGKGRTLEIWDDENGNPVVAKVINIVKGYDKVIDPTMILHVSADDEYEDYFYELEFVEGGNKETVWASEPWMEQEINYEQQELDEWKVQSGLIINPDDVDKYGDFLPNYRKFIIGSEAGDIEEWLDEYFPGWENDPYLNEKGNTVFEYAVKRAAQIKYGNDITVGWDLNEWKIQQQPVIDPENLDDFGYHDSYLNEFVIEPDPHKYANWLDRYFPGWENNLDIETTGAKAFRSAIKKAIISKYGDQVRRIYIGV